MASRGDFGYGAVSEFHDDPSMPSRPLGGGRGAASGLPAPFAELSEQVGADIFAIGNHAHSLNRVASKINEDADIPDIKSEIGGIQQQIAVRVQSASMKLKELSSLQAGSRGRVANQEKLHLERLKKEFQDAVQQFSQAQKKTADRMRSSFVKKKQEPQPKPTTKTSVWMDEDDLMMTDDQKAGLVAHDNVNHEQRQAQLQIEQEQAEADLAIFQEREEAIRNLERDILDINDIFKELGAMVSEQGEIIDSIESNVERAQDQVETGAVHLEKAKVYQAKSRKKMCILLLILTVVAGVLALIIYFSLKKLSNGDKKNTISVSDRWF